MYAYAAGSPGTFGQEGAPEKQEAPPAPDYYSRFSLQRIPIPIPPQQTFYTQLTPLPEKRFPWAVVWIVGGVAALGALAGGTAYRRRRKRRR